MRQRPCSKNWPRRCGPAAPASRRLPDSWRRHLLACHDMRRAAACALISTLLASALIAPGVGAQPVTDPTAPDNLRCPGPNFSFDPATQQIVYVWENVVTYEQTFDDLG